ncbi:MAG: DnaJ family molecular chaperone [Pseudomonadota bacterium]
MVWSRIAEALGVAEGGALRGALDAILCGFGIGDCKTTNEVAFTAAVIALSAKMAKADGVATRIEVEAFERLFKPPPGELANVRRLFDLATRDVAGYESYARQIAKLLSDEPRLKRDVYDGLFHIAAADGVLHADEEVYLRRVGEIFGYDEAEYRSIRALFVHDPDDAYTVLGVSPDITDEALKTHYRALVRENHPDVLSARGVPGQFIDIATRKIAAINSAYNEIARERGLT